MSYPFNIASQRCTLTGLNGAALSAGTVLTLASDGEDAIRAITMENGLFKVDYSASLTTDQSPVHHPYIKNPDGEWIRTSTLTYGDGWFCVRPFATPYDRVEVVEANQDVIEVAFQYLNVALDIPYLNNLGVINRDQNLGVNYTQAAVMKWLTDINVTKTIRMERGVQGYWMSMNTEPRVAPPLWLLTAPGATSNNENDYGEREIWTSENAAVLWSSNPLAGVSHHPAWGARAIWDTAAIAIGQAINNKTWWAGIDDATYSIMAHAGYKQTQWNSAGFPRQQLTGPWYIADISAESNVCRYVVQQDPLETGGWQFSSSQYGKGSSHFVHGWPGKDGREKKFPVFYGAVYYVADATAGPLSGYSGNVAYANEPSAAIQARIAALATERHGSWPR